MNDANAAQSSHGTNFGDLLYILFRHKWKIALITGVSLIAALALPFVIPQTFESQAKLDVLYVPEPGTFTELESGKPVLPAPRSETLMNTELEILRNLSLAQEVANSIGVEKILGTGNADADKAALALFNGLSVEVPRNTTVLQISFKHTNPALVQPVVQQLIEAYLRKHAETHTVSEFEESLMRELDSRRSRLQQSREELNRVKEAAGVTSLEEAKRACNERFSTVQQQLSDAETELAAQRARVNELTRGSSAPYPAITNNPPATGNFVQAPPERVAEYRAILTTIGTLRNKEQELLGIFTRSNPLVRDVQSRIAENEGLKMRLEAEFPALAAVSGPEQAVVPMASSSNQLRDMVTEMAQLKAAEAKASNLEETLAQVRKQITTLNKAESGIKELETRVELEEAQYKRLGEKLDQLRTNTRVGGGRVLNIVKIQPPSPPMRVTSKVPRLIALVLLGGLGVALGLAVLLELYVDPTVKRSQDVEKMRLPLFMSVPLLNGRKTPFLAQKGGGETATGASDGETVSELAPWGPQHALRPFSEALRDKLINWFELKQMTHKPKLVALTGCAEGAGVSTFAAGLASSLSETGEGNVLLVDMNAQNGSAHHFRRGDLACGLDDALTADKRESALVLEKLYVVSEAPNSEKLPSFLPQRFRGLVPKLKASDYDYIIFDMPPVSQVGITQRLSRFMDLVLIVVESERTDREVVRKASILLSEPQANIGVVLNKCRNYVPRALKQEI